jgi:hypothetical protein
MHFLGRYSLLENEGRVSHGPAFNWSPMLTKIALRVLALALFAAPCLSQTQGFLGIRPKDNKTPDHCLEIELLAPSGPGEKAGLEPGDIVLSIDGVAIDCANLNRGAPLAPRAKGGDRVDFRVLRAGKILEIAVTAEALPERVVKAREEHARREAGRAIFDRLVKAQEIFTITLEGGGKFKVSGKFSAEEAELLHFYFEKAGDGAAFPKAMKSNRQDMYVRFDRERGVYEYEFVDASKPAAASGQQRRP